MRPACQSLSPGRLSSGRFSSGRFSSAGRGGEPFTGVAQTLGTFSFFQLSGPGMPSASLPR